MDKKYLDEEGREEIAPGVFIRLIYKNPAYRNEWLRVRRKALKRDNYTCLLCGITKEKLLENPTGVKHKDYLNVHHLEPPSQELDKIVTLCWDCHKKIEGKISIKDEQGRTTGHIIDKKLRDETRSKLMKIFPLKDN